MTKTMKTLLFALVLLSVCFLASSCVFFSVRPERVTQTAKTTYVFSASKVHLNDGSVVVFPRGFKVAKGVVKAEGGDEGVRYDLLRDKVGRVESVPLDSVVYMQCYKDSLMGRRLTASLTGTLACFVALMALIMAATPPHHL